ncbi:VWA domain-containing protein [Desulfovibrio aerotolerans]|uniref:VWA domain-containing protein n=1 Tax=Solidesulfovibrio aerotolerans TaxID=295255 RepID=A0A7C9MYJ0_9BACT|nr:VWA domain-containing protein [Solidesulfovibrio aerotolerans]MYL81597.1 VWA domain-containing protein [Solidesulfovibrio aerotolerans]
MVVAHPLALLLLLALPAIWFARNRTARLGALGLPDLTTARAAGRPSLTVFLPGVLRALGLTLAILALAGPGLAPTEPVYRGQGVDIMLAIDLSESMAAMDMRQTERTITRLEAVAEAAARFASSRPGDRIGLVAFGSRAYTVIPPTLDRSVLTQALARLEVGAAGRKTAMGDALGLAVKRLAQGPGLSRVAVVFGDGRSNAGEIDPQTAAEAAAAHGVRVFTVGVGGDEPAAFLVNHPLLGRQIVYEKAPVDTEALTAMARLGGGEFFRAEDAAGLARAGAAIDTLAPSDSVAVPQAGVSLAPGLAALAVGLLTSWAGLAATRFLRLP